MGYRNDQSRDKEAKLNRQLDEIAAELAPTLPASLRSRLENVAAAVRLRAAAAPTVSPALIHTR